MSGHGIAYHAAETAGWVYWYNQAWIHLSIGRMSPVRYEAAWAASQPAEVA